MISFKSWLGQFDWGAMVGSGIALAFYLCVAGPVLINSPILFGHHKEQAADNNSKKDKQIAQPQSGEDALATYTLWLVVFTGILAISTIALWRVTAKTLSHSQDDAARQARENRVSLRISVRAANAARRSAEAAVSAQRAWINFSTEPSGDMIFNDDGCHFSIAARTTNDGNAPATNVVHYIEVVPAAFGVESFSEGFAKIEKAIAEADVDTIGHAMFPKEERDLLVYKIVVPKEDIAAAIEQSKSGKHPGKIVFNTAITATYCYKGGAGRTSRTSFIWTYGDIFEKWGMLDPATGRYLEKNIVISQVPTGAKAI